MDRWGQLNLQQKNQLLGIYASKGYTDLASIISHYNSFQEGGSLGHITPYGQWEYPHQVTTIPSNNITMKGVDYPVLGVSDTGDTKYMLPNMDYLFDGNYVTEYPLHKFQRGGNTDGISSGRYRQIDKDTFTPEYSLPTVTIEAEHPLWSLPWYKDKKNNSNINRYKDQLYNNWRRHNEAGKRYLANIGKTALVVGSLPALAYGAATAPVATALSIIGGEGLNYGIDKLTPYNSWGNMLAEGVFNTDNELAQTILEFTNPGFLLGPKAAPFVNNQYRGLRIANELKRGIRNTELQPRIVKNAAHTRTKSGDVKIDNPNSTLDMGEVWRIENDYNNIVNTNDWSLLPSLRARHFKLLSGNAITDNEGNLLNLWHGTPNGYFNVFRQQGGIGRATNIGFYSTPNKDYASRYTARDIRWGTPSETPAILELYGRGNLVPDRMLGNFPATVLQHTTPEDVLKIRNLEYDGIRSANLLGKRAEINLFDPNNYKSKAAVTYDDLGNIIPLSKRDNFSNLDMRYKNGGKLKST